MKTAKNSQKAEHDLSSPLSDSTLNTAYQELLEQKQIFELIANHTPALISYVDSRERYRFTNLTFKNWIGYTNEETQGKTVREIRGEEAYSAIRGKLKKALQGDTVSFDHVLKKANGEEIMVHSSYQPHLDKKGNVLGVFVLLTDITERKRTESRLKESEARFRRFVDANIMGVIICQLDGTVLEANDIFLDMVGYTRKDLRSGVINWKELTPTEYLFLNKRAEEEILQRGSCTPFEKEYIRKDGSRIPVLIGDILLDKSSQSTISFILDMTKQHELQERKDEFIALASHELKTPLTSLKLYSQVLLHQMKLSKDNQTKKLFVKMDKQIITVHKLVNNLLDVSRLQSGKLTYTKTRFSIKSLLVETVNELQKIMTSHELLVQGASTARVKADRDRIKQVISNLITNAIKYSPKAGKIIITLTEEDASVKVAIKDFGIGIDKMQQKQIFERYFQAKAPKQQSPVGLGLGLYLSKEIIQQHKGNIWFDSKLGKGSVFYFTLPIR